MYWFIFRRIVAIIWYVCIYVSLNVLVQAQNPSAIKKKCFGKTYSDALCNGEVWLCVCRVAFTDDDDEFYIKCCQSLH